MEPQEIAEVCQSLPVLSRLDRLDLWLKLLEERHYLSASHSISASNPVITKMKKEDECKTLFSALEEVNHKGTLMERLTMLETRVLQLSQEMEVGKTSGSSSSTIQVPEKNEPIVGRHTLLVQDKQDPLIFTQESSLVEACETKSQGCHKPRRRTTATTMPPASRKWFGCFPMGC